MTCPGSFASFHDRHDTACVALVYHGGELVGGTRFESII